jgi:hypothetical protein
LDPDSSKRRGSIRGSFAVLRSLRRLRMTMAVVLVSLAVSSADFQTMIFRVMAIGLFVIGAGTVALLFAFRALGEKSERQGIVTLVGALALIIVLCAVLFRLSYGAR